ncbi:MAG TPA: hypothetical protein VGK56_14410 [Anaerolineales bacterium]
MDTGSVDLVFVAGKVMKGDDELLHAKVIESRDHMLKKSGFKLPAT